MEPAEVFPPGTAVDLFAGFPVSHYPTAAEWYERLLGTPPAFLPDDVEAVWTLAENRHVFIRVAPEHAGHASNLLFLGDLEAFVQQAADRGVHPAVRETLGSGVRKVIYDDPDGNEVGFGGAP